MAGNNTYKVEFKADVKQFTTQINQAGEQFHKFEGKLSTGIQKVQVGFNGFIKYFAIFKATFEGGKKLFEGYEKIMTSTAEGQQRWNTLMESGKAGVDAFFQGLSTGALNGGFGNFIENISTAITLTANYQTALNNFKVTQFVNQLDNIGNKLKINQLELEKLQTQQAGGDTAPIDKKIGVLKGEEIINAESDLRSFTAEYDAWIRKITNYKGPTWGEDLIKQFEDFLKIDPTSFLDERAYKSYLRDAAELESLSKTRNEGLKESFNNRRQGTGLVHSTADKLKVNVNEDVRKEAAERAKKIAELKGIRIKADKEAADAQIKSDEEAAAAAIKIAEEKAVAAKKIQEDLNRWEKEEYLKKVQFELDAYSDKLYRQMTKEERYGGAVKVKKIQSNPALMPSQAKPKLAKPKERSFTQNPFVSDGEIAKYDAIQQKMTNLQQAIAINTQLYGAQSLQVSTLQSQLDDLQDPEGWNRLGEAVDGISSAIDTMAGSIDGIKDNPAIKALAFGLQLLAGVKAIASAKNWVEFIVATAGVGASIIGFVSSMKGQSFAGGGIVAPAAVGDQVNIRANPGEMILNNRQQTRLFNLVNGQKEQSANNQVVFRLQGQELVGLINNYSKKHS